MNVDIQSSAGLRVYRELIEKETGAPARWEQTFGVKSQLQPKRSLLLVNDFEAAVSLPLPLSMQLFQLQREKIKCVREGHAWECANLPKLSKIPISQTSVDVFGDAVCRQQRPNAAATPDRRPVTAPLTSSFGAPHRCETSRRVAPTARRHARAPLGTARFVTLRSPL
jgi:hypothetical protein